jgi:protein-tyrosine phosphatase
MIDLHSHILPGIDDGAPDLATSLDMARAWVADGVSVLACTPHILPGLYHNTGPEIRVAVTALQRELDDRGIPLYLVTGADNHVIPEFVQGLRSGHLLSIADTRYVLVEPPHHIAPPRMEDLFFNIMAAGYVPVLTHPERLSWIKTHYDVVRRLARRGVWMQITAGALTGSFGRSPLYWGERMLDEGCVHILATDAHDMRGRPPVLGEGYERAARRVGAKEAEHLVYTRPLAIVENRPPSSVPMPTPVSAGCEVTYAKNGSSVGERKRERSADRGVFAGVRGVSERLQRLFG